MTALLRAEDGVRALAACVTLEEVRKIRDMAEQARQYARAKNLGIDAQNHGTELRLWADRRMGEMLIEAKETGEIKPHRHEKGFHEGTVKLGDLGLSKKQSYTCQQMAAIPESSFTERIEEAKGRQQRVTTSTVLVKESKPKPIATRVEGDYTLLHSSCCDLRLDIEVDAIVTDPPYPKDFLPVYSDLGELAARVLKPGGSLFVMVGQSYLPEVMARLCAHMTYHWTLAYLTPGGQATQLWAKNVNTFWKPVLWFTRGTYTGKWLGDVAKSHPNDNDKRFHYWGQSESGMLDLIERCTEPGEMILDPFLGGGTTGIVALTAGRRFIGSDIDADVVRKAGERFNANL